MTKREFVKKYRLSDAFPIDPSKKAIPAEAFSVAISEFMEDRFEGVVNVICKNVCAHSIFICSEYVAYFFKMLIADVYGRQLLKMSIFSDEKKLNIEITAEEALPLADAELRELVKLARNGGFEILIENYPEVVDKIKLTVDYYPTIPKRIYAVSIKDGRRIMLGKMDEIFSLGEPMNTEPLPKRPQPKPITKRPLKKEKPQG